MGGMNGMFGVICTPGRPSGEGAGVGVTAPACARTAAGAAHANITIRSEVGLAVVRFTL
jgi:hypothetical protein